MKPIYKRGKSKRHFKLQRLPAKLVHQLNVKSILQVHNITRGLPLYLLDCSVTLPCVKSALLNLRSDSD